jgi:aerobic carbon-monoxide dehydrogenase medium subunit
MMPLRRFTIHQPKTIAEASQMLADFGEKARFYAGGTELLLAMKHDLLRYEHLVDVKTIPELNKIELKNGSLVIGSTATHRAIERAPVVKENLPALAQMETNVANVRVRASGTLGGNLCFAEPHSDPATLLLALGAKARVQGKAGTKTLGIDKLITGAYETSLAADELMVGVEIPIPEKSQRAAYLKFQLNDRRWVWHSCWMLTAIRSPQPGQSSEASARSQPNPTKRTGSCLVPGRKSRNNCR